jgi:chromosome segregation ATPase
VPFGFFRKKESEKPAERPTVAAPAAGALSIEQARDLLNNIESAMVQELAARLALVRQSATQSLQSIGALANEMDHEKLKLEGLELRYRSVAENTKRTIVSSLRREAATELQQIQSANDAKKFKERFEAMMKRLGEVSGSHSKVINAFMKKHANKMKEEFEALTELLNETRTEISDFEKKRAPIVKCSGILNTASQKASSIRASEASLQGIENDVKRMQDELESLKAELETLKASPEFGQAQAVAQRVADAEAQKEQFRAQLTDHFAHVSRAFTKYSYGLTRETEARLQMMSEEPWKMFDEADISPYTALLQEVRKSIDSGKIQLKDSDKILHYFDTIVNSLPEFQSKARALGELTDSLKQSDVSLVNKSTEIEARITQHEEEVARGKQNTEQLRRQIAEKGEELASQLRDASSILEELTGQKYHLEYC